MALKMRKEAAIPDGQHTGVITAARETTKTFDRSEGPKPVVEITIKPDWKSPDGGETLSVSVAYSPVLNGLSGLSQLLERLDMEPEEGAAWTPGVLVGRKVRFSAARNEGGFVQLDKASITAA